MLNLTDILQLIVNRLNESPFAEEQLIPPPHQPILHVLADFGQEFEPLSKEHIVQRLGNIPTVPKELPKQLLGEGWHRLAVVDIARSQAKGQEFPLIPTPHQQGVDEEATDTGSPRWSWARLLKRVFALDMARCPFCQQGTLRIIAAITPGAVIRKILPHLKQSAAPPPIAPARLRQDAWAWASA